MKKPGKHQLMLAVSSLVCVVVALRNTNGLEGTEFSGGWLTGPLLLMTDAGTALFALALVVSFVCLRFAGVIGLVASLLCLPLYLYLVAPVPFSKVFGSGHEFKVQPAEDFHWNTWAMAGVLSLAVSTYVCVRGLEIANRAQAEERAGEG